MPPHLACSRCDGPVSHVELREGLAVRIDGNLVCGVCIEQLPQELQDGIAKARNARGMGLVVQSRPHPRHPDLTLFEFVDAAAIMRHRRSIGRGTALITKPLSRLATSTWIPRVILGAVGLLAVTGISLLILAKPSRPTAPTPPDVSPAAPTVVAQEAPKPAPASAPAPAPASVPTAAATTTPVKVPTPTPSEPAAPPVAALPTAAIPVTVAAPPEPRQATSASEQPALRRVIPLEAQAVVGGSNEDVQPFAPPLPWPIIGDVPPRLNCAAIEVRDVPWRGRWSLSIAASAQAGGVVVCVHPGRKDREMIEVWRGEPAKQDRTITLTNAWQTIVIEGPGPIALVDPAKGYDIPFWTIGGVQVTGGVPTTKDLPLRPVPLSMGNDRRLRSLLGVAKALRGKPMDPEQFQVALDRTHVDEASFRRWQTPIRQSWTAQFGERVPNGALTLVDLLPEQGEGWQPDKDRCHLLFLGLEGRDADLPAVELATRLRDLQSALRDKNPKTGKGLGIISVIIVGSALTDRAAIAAWKPVIDRLHRQGDPWLDLRGIEPADSGPVIGQAVANLVAHLSWLQQRTRR